MKNFYREYKDVKLVQQFAAQVPWNHNIMLKDKGHDNEIRKIYFQDIIKNSCGSSMLINPTKVKYHL